MLNRVLNHNYGCAGSTPSLDGRTSTGSVPFSPLMLQQSMDVGFTPRSHQPITIRLQVLPDQTVSLALLVNSPPLAPISPNPITTSVSHSQAEFLRRLMDASQAMASSKCCINYGKLIRGVSVSCSYVF